MAIAAIARDHHACVGAPSRSIRFMVVFQRRELVELRRIELLTSAVRLQRSPI